MTGWEKADRQVKSCRLQMRTDRWVSKGQGEREHGLMFWDSLGVLVADDLLPMRERGMLVCICVWRGETIVVLVVWMRQRGALKRECRQQQASQEKRKRWETWGKVWGTAEGQDTCLPPRWFPLESFADGWIPQTFQKDLYTYIYSR